MKATSFPRPESCARALAMLALAVNARAELSIAAAGSGSASGRDGAPVTHQLQADFEGMFASDIRLTQSTVAYGQKRERFEFNASVAYNTFDLDYQPAPFDFLGTPAHVDERRTAAALGVRTKLLDPLTLLFSGGLYEGFADYRSAWLNEYYRQQFSSVTGFGDEYVTPSPRGENISLGLRWEYLPTTGFVQGDIGYLHDRIAPGYEIDFDGLRSGRPNLYTASYHLAFENVLTRRLRVLNEFRLTDTTNREQRYGYQGSLNLALGERWVVRAFGGYTQERPAFEAHYFGGTVEYEPETGWLLSVSGRQYRDTGEIENSLFSSAAPGLDAWQAGFGLRRLWGVHSVKLFVAPYFTHYEPAGIGTAFFQNLYRNRAWGVIQIAYASEF